MPPIEPLAPSLFDPSQASPEMQAAVRDLEAMMIPSLVRPLTAEEAQAVRALGPAGGLFTLSESRSDRAEVRSIPGPAGEIELRCFAPRSGKPRATLLHIHGGAWFLGSADMMDAVLESRADALDLAVASVEYRLAPEHVYPAGPDDCEAAALWLARNAKAELGAELALVAGESAGAHLSATTLLRMRDRHDFHFAGANLVYGLYDLGGVPSHTQFDGRGLVFDSRGVRSFIEMFVPDAARLRDPDVSPLYADLSALCPALFTVGTCDPLVDHTLFMYARWVAAGNPAEIQVYPGAPHGFDAFPAPEGPRAHAACDAFLNRCLGERDGAPARRP
jgi:acetyl esterase